MKLTVVGVSGIFFCAAISAAFSHDYNDPPALLLRTIAPVAATPPLHFNDLADVYRYIIQSRGLGKSEDNALVGALTASSTVKQVRDSSGKFLTVMKADLVADGRSRLASPEGNFPHYVLRQGADGITLLGTMYGESYAAGIKDGHLQFTMQLRMATGQEHEMRYQVRDDALVNLTPLHSERHPYISDV
jgi:hypothetical protein